MAQGKWDPARGVSAFRREMDKLLEEFEEFLEKGPARFWERPFEPAVDIVDTRDTIIVRAQVPGVSRESLELTVTDDAVTLKGEVKAEEGEAYTVHQQEIRYGPFSRTIALPIAVESDKATARLKDGILEIRIPKKEVARIRQVPIET